MLRASHIQLLHTAQQRKGNIPIYESCAATTMIVKMNLMFLSLACFAASFAESFSIPSQLQQRQTITALHLSGKLDPARRIAEIEEMGGDPFFFTMDDDDEEETQEEEEEEEQAVMPSMSFMAQVGVANAVVGGTPAQRCATDGLGPTPKNTPDVAAATAAEKKEEGWEWDGSVDEDAHLGLD